MCSPRELSIFGQVILISDKEKDADVAQNKTRFEDLPLSQELINGIKGANFEFCTPIQASSLPFSLNGRGCGRSSSNGYWQDSCFSNNYY